MATPSRPESLPEIPAPPNRRQYIGIELVFLVAGIVVVFSVAAFYFGTSHVISSNVLQTRLLRRVYDWQQLLTTLHDAEMAQRDFLLTDDEPSYRIFTEVVPRIQASVKTLSTDSETESVTQELQGLVARRLTLLQTAIDLHRAGKFDELKAFVRKREGRLTMERLGELAAQTQLQEEQSVEVEIKRQNESVQSMTVILALLGTANFILLGWSYKRIESAMASRDAALSFVRQR